MENKDTTPRKNWDLMIGIALVIFGGFRLYQYYQSQTDWNYRTIFTLLFIGYGGFLIFKYFRNTKKE